MAAPYLVKVAISMSSNHATVLGALATHLMGIHGHVRQLQSGFSRLHVAIGSALAFGAGAGLLTVMGKLVVKTKDYSEELVKIERLGGGMAAAVNSGAFEKKAFAVARATGMDVTQAMKIPGMTYSILGEKESMEHWESLGKLSTVLMSQNGYRGDPTKDIGDLIRAGEMSGRFTDPKTKQIDPQKFEAFLDTATKIIASTHGMVNAQTLLGMSKQGGFMMRGLSEEGFYSMAIMAQAMGGNRAGTALLSLGQQMLGGQMHKRSAQGLEKIGILHHGEWSTVKGSGGVELGDVASSRLAGLIQKDPMALAGQFIEQFRKKGITDPEEQMRMILRAAGRQTTQRFTAEEILNFNQMKKEIERMKGGYNKEDSFETIMSKSVPANMLRLSHAWNNLMYAIAGPNSPGVVNVLKSLTSSLDWLQIKILDMNPAMISTIAVALGGFAAALTVLGAIGLFMSLPFSAVAAGIILVGSAIYGLSQIEKDARNWSIVKSIRGMMGRDDQTRAESRKKIAEEWAAITGWFKTHSLKDEVLKWLNEVLAGVKIFFGVGAAAAAPGQGGPKNALGLNADDRAANREAVGKLWDKAMSVFSRGGSLGPASFHPGKNEVKVPPMSMTLNIDSMPLAKAVAESLSILAEHPTTPPSPNGWAASIGY